MSGTGLSDTVVLVDDEHGIRTTLDFIFYREGIELSLAENGQEGIELVERVRPKVVLLDVMMPRMDGYQVCRAIRGNPELDGMFVLMLTARGLPSDRARAMEAGADCYISKPFDHEIVVKMVRNVLGGRIPDDVTVAAVGKLASAGFGVPGADCD